MMSQHFIKTFHYSNCMHGGSYICLYSKESLMSFSCRPSIKYVIILSFVRNHKWMIAATCWNNTYLLTLCILYHIFCHRTKHGREKFKKVVFINWWMKYLIALNGKYIRINVLNLNWKQIFVISIYFTIKSHLKKICD